MNRIQSLVSLGQSLWYDNIQRSLLESGEFAAMIDHGDIRGVTSNPSIYLNAIAKTNDYDQALFPMAVAGWEPETIFWQLAKEDIQQTCDLFLPIFNQTKGGDGYVSLEVHPDLANDAGATLVQARHLWETINRPNLMVKIPATKPGLVAIRSAIAEGINVNVTLIFSIERYKAVMEAYLSGLEDWFESTQNLCERQSPASVASFFISRIDTKVDAVLPPDSNLKGKAAIASARIAYGAFEQVFNSPRWQKLAGQGARVQRPLWASTSTKNPAYPDTIYVDGLIGPDTINTVPPQTLVAFRDHGTPSITISQGRKEAEAVFNDLQEQGISMVKVTDELEKEGVAAFSKAFAALIKAIEERSQAINNSLGSLSSCVRRRMTRLNEEGFTKRLWDHDASLWTNEPGAQKEIRQRMGWLNLPISARGSLDEINTISESIHTDGIRKILLLGMGGSSLAPEVLATVLANDRKVPEDQPTHTDPVVSFSILDSTDPTQVLSTAREYPPGESIYIVSSKSGGTEEVKALTDYFWQISGQDGVRFIAITDPGTSLDSLAQTRGFRATLRANPSVGGRFSVFSEFGLLPMKLMGIDPARMLKAASLMMDDCKADIRAGRNPGLTMGAILGEAALAGRNKLTLITDPPLTPFGSWLEQLIAESTGKMGKGIIVIDGEPIMKPEQYGADRLFIHLKNDAVSNPAVDLLKQSGHPILEFVVPDMYALSREFYRWEIATAVACHILQVNAFDQPDVQDNKDRTKLKIKAFRENGLIEEGIPLWEGNGVKVFSNQDIQINTWENALPSLLHLTRQGDYIAINGYLPRNTLMQAALMELRRKVSLLTGAATTVGFGPRFLHSTGQLHKGGPENALFIQLTADPLEDIDIPGQVNGFTFGKLERAQAIGDYEALAARGRKIIRLHFSSAESIQQQLGLMSANLFK